MDKKKYTDETLIKMIRGNYQERMVALRYIHTTSGWLELTKKILQKNQIQEADIKDALQEGLITLDEHIRNLKFKGDSSLKVFFIGICKGRVYSNRRSIKRQIYTAEVKTLDKINNDNPELKMMDIEHKEMIQQLLSKIGEPCKTVLTLYQLSYSMKEIATKIGKSEAMAKKMSFTCRKKLRSFIDQNPHLLDYLKF